MERLHTPEQAARWLRRRVTGSLWTDSRKVSVGDGFIAWPGAATDGRKYVHDVLAAGALACLVEHEGAASYDFTDSRVAAYSDLKIATAPIAAAYFGQPSKQLDVLAVTGTNGKTSTAWWLAQALGKLGRRCGVVGTLGIGQPDAMVFNGLTTPDPVMLQQQLRRWVDDGFSACTLEASSIGIAEHRLDATDIHVAIFTNFTQDHLDYHHTMQSYWEAKVRLFGWSGLKAAVLNIDDVKGAALAVSLQDAGLDVWTVSCAAPARLQAQAITHGPEALSFDVVEGAARHRISTGLVGRYNVSNLLGVMAALRALGLPLPAIVEACADLLPVPGRMDAIAIAGRPLVIVDYAHTPDALDKVLVALKPLLADRTGQLWCVFGCGGGRDAGKRPLMAAVAEKHADRIVVTSDNPRSENPAAIISQILQGFSHREAVSVEPDRALAIAHAISLARSGDVVLIAGKGHESHQEIGGVKLPFSDKSQAAAALGHGMMTLQQALHWLPSARLVGEGTLQFQRVHSDTRSLQPGDLFVAIKGERFDAHDFLAQAKSQGAVAALAEHGLSAELPGLLVADARQALGQLAAGWRSQFSLPLIAVTGSNGKTTVTQMIAAILRAWRQDGAFATQGNFNNDIGLPLTLLRLRAGHRAGVVELGMNHPGEIDYLAGLAQPTVALVNNAQREHLEFMATVEAVARENGAVIASLSASGVAVFPADEVYTPIWKTLAADRTVLTFAESGAADVTASADWMGSAWQVTASTPQGALAFSLQVAGRHNVKNALAATACALAAGVPLAAIAAGLCAFTPVKGRSRAHQLSIAGRAITLIDDSYNANPDSMRAAIDVLADLPGPRLLVLGDMGEVGDRGPALHLEVGDYARQRGIEALLCMGELMTHAATAFPGARHFGSMADLLDALRQNLAQQASVLVKGSRFMKMEQVVQALLADAMLPAQQEQQAQAVRGLTCY